MNNHFELMFNEEQKAVDARIMYDNLGLNPKNWSNWNKANIISNEYFKENESWQGFLVCRNGNETKNFWLSLEMAKHLCMISKGKTAHEVREYFLECERKLKEPVQVRESLSTLDVLKLATAEIEKLEQQNLQLMDRNKQVTGVLEAIQTHGDNLLFREFVKIVYSENGITIGEQEFRELLRKHKYIDYKNFPYAQYKQYFNVNEGTKNGHPYATTRLTPRGRLYFTEKLIKMYKKEK